MIKLQTKSGKSINPVGLGTFPLKGKEMADVFYNAVINGYHIVDTSDDYQNEDGIGLGLSQIISDGIAKREDIFIQTKVSDCDSFIDDYRQNSFFTMASELMKSVSIEDVVRSKVENSMKEIGTDYMDSVLLHFPYPYFYKGMWESLVKLKNEGFIRYIGVSNFNVKELISLSYSSVMPQINEVYMSPFGIRQDIIDYCNNNEIQLMTYSPLCVTRRFAFKNEIFERLSHKYNKTKSQIILKWNIQKGSIPLAKTSSVSRLKENIDLFDFELLDSEMKELDRLDFNHQSLPISKENPGL